MESIQMIKPLFSNTHLENSDNYFSPQKKNQKNGIRYDENRNIVPYSIVGTKSLFDMKQKSSQIVKKTESTKSLNLIKFQSNSSTPQLKNQQHIVTFNQIPYIYQKIKARLSHNNSNEKLNIPETIKKELQNQEKRLNLNKKYEEETLKISKDISRRIGRKEEELIYNSSQCEIIKREYSKFGEKQRSLNDFSNQWMMMLRNSSDLKRTNYFNAGTDSHPKWVRKPHNHENQRNDELIIPITKSVNLPSLNKVFSRRYIKELAKKSHFDLTKFIDNNQLKIIGKEVLEEERNKLKNFNGKKILHVGNTEELNLTEELIIENFITRREKTLSQEYN